MNVILLVTRSCHHCPLIEKELQNRSMDYEVVYVEDHPDLAARYGTKKSPNLIVDGELVYRGMPEMAELTRYLDELKSNKQQPS